MVRFFILLMAALPLATAHAAERLEAWTAAAGVAEFRLNTYRGQVTVEAAEDDVLRVEVRALTSAANQQRAAAQLKAIRMVWVTVGDWCTLDISEPTESGARFAWQDRDPVTVEIRVAMPALRKLQVASNDGAVRIGRITADVEVQARRGQVTSTLVQGNLAVRAQDRSILASRVLGDADLRSEFGNVSAGTIGGNARLFARNGDIELLAAKGGFDAESDGGNVTVSLTSSLKGAGRAESAGGTITLKIDPAADLSLGLSTSWGRIRDRSPARTVVPIEIISGGFGGKKLNARMNYGRVEVRAHASGGNVDLVAAESAF